MFFFYFLFLNTQVDTARSSVCWTHSSISSCTRITCSPRWVRSTSDSCGGRSTWPRCRWWVTFLFLVGCIFFQFICVFVWECVIMHGSLWSQWKWYSRRCVFFVRRRASESECSIICICLFIDLNHTFCMRVYMFKLNPLIMMTWVL